MKISSQEEFSMSSDSKEPVLAKGELIHLISDLIEQTDNDLDKQATLREIIDEQFQGRVIDFNQNMLKIILLFQFIPQLSRIFMENNLIWNYITLGLQGVVVVMMVYIEFKQYMYDRQNYFKTFWNYNDMLYVVINIV